MQQKKNIKLAEVENFKNIAGYGVRAECNGNTYLIGNSKLMKENNVAIENKLQDEEELESDGNSILFVAEAKKQEENNHNYKLIALIGVKDVIKDSAKDVENGAILDGFPRTAMQAEALKNFLKENKPNAKRVAIELDVPDDEIIRRVVNRLICSNKSCGAIYNKETKPPKKEGICDICGGELKKRDDDNRETVTKRLAIYRQNSKDLVDFYRKNNALYTIYPKDVDVAVKDIKKFLEEYKKGISQG